MTENLNLAEEASQTFELMVPAEAVQDIFNKAKVYVSNPKDAPAGVELQHGPGGGLFYNTGIAGGLTGKGAPVGAPGRDKQSKDPKKQSKGSKEKTVDGKKTAAVITKRAQNAAPEVKDLAGFMSKHLATKDFLSDKDIIGLAKQRGKEKGYNWFAPLKFLVGDLDVFSRLNKAEETWKTMIGGTNQEKIDTMLGWAAAAGVSFKADNGGQIDIRPVKEKCPSCKDLPDFMKLEDFVNRLNSLDRIRARNHIMKGHSSGSIEHKIEKSEEESNLLLIMGVLP